MKFPVKYIKIIIIISIILNFINCAKSNEPTFNAIKNYNGSIDSYNGTDFDSILVFASNVDGTNYNIKLPVTPLSNGNFSFTFTNPDSKLLSTFWALDVSISDPSVLQIEYQGGHNGFPIYKGENETGKILKTNLSLSQYQHGEIVDGTAFVNFIYVNKAVRLKGINVGTTESYDLNLNKGWNEVVETYTSVSNNSPTSKSWTNVMPSGMKWIIDAFITPKDLLGTVWRSSHLGLGYDYGELRFTTTSSGEIWMKMTSSDTPFKIDTFTYLISGTTITINVKTSGDRPSGLLWRNTINLEGLTYTKQ